MMAVLVAALLLLLGFVLRARLRILQLLFIPASVTGGLLGLLAVQGALRLDPERTGDEARMTAGEIATDLASTLGSWPGTLIAVVFAGLLLEPPRRRVRSALRGAAQAGIYAWIVIVGQIMLGLLATALLIAPGRDVPAAFGQLLEAGFAGGHATAAALGTVLSESIGFDAGLDLGLFMATVGLVYSVVSGIVLVNVAVRRGWTRAGRAGRRLDVTLVTGLEPRRAPTPAAFARVAGEVIDPLAFQAVLMGIAVLIGVGLQAGVTAATGETEADSAWRAVERLPLFLFTLLGGWILRALMTVLRVDDLIDPESIRRLVAIAMEFLIVAAIASLRIEVVIDYLGPLSILCVVGFVWTGFCLLVLTRLILPATHWFELGIINYGMSTGTTAQGLMLLRIVDPDLESGAAEEYALAAPLSAPFIGGGLITMALPLILTRVSATVVVAGAAVLVLALVAIGSMIRRRTPS